MSQKITAFARFILIALFVSVVAVRADDEPKRGTLPDGRAFRTDGEGNQLVDYIAELEVSVDTLEKRVYGLEDEVKEKQAAIDRLQRGEGATVKVSERELLQPKQIEREACPPAPVCPERLACPAQQRCDDHSGEIATLRSSLTESKTETAQVKAQLVQARTQLEQERTARSQEVASYEGALQKLEGPAKSSAQQVAVLSRSLEQTRLQVQHEADQREKQEQEFQNALRQKERELQTKEQELQAKEQEIDSKDIQISAKASELGRLKNRVAELQDVQAKAQLRAEAPVAPAAVVSYHPSTMPPPTQPQFARSGVAASAGTLVPMPSSLLSARERAMDGLRTEISSNLARLNMEIQTRDALFAHWDQRGRALQIKPSLLRTARNSTPNSISRDLTAASSVRDLVILRDEVRQLEGSVIDDIAVVRRMSGKK